MGSIKYTYTIDYNDEDPTNPTFASTPSSPPDLYDGDWVVVKLGSDFPAGSSIDTLSFYSDSDEKTLVCEWNRGGANNCGSIYKITATSDTEVKIEDAGNPTINKEEYWFEVSGSPDSWKVDPELINEPDVG